MRRNRLFLLGAVVAAAFLVTLFVLAGDGSSAPAKLSNSPSVTVGKGGPRDARAAQRASYSTLDGGTTTLAAYAGRPVVVNFFANWCAPCKAEMPDIQKVHDELGATVAFVGLDLQETAKEAKAAVDAAGVRYDIGLDNGDVFQAFGGFSLPVTALIRPDGSIADVHQGQLDADGLRSLIQKKLL